MSNTDYICQKWLWAAEFAIVRLKGQIVTSQEFTKALDRMPPSDFFDQIDSTVIDCLNDEPRLPRNPFSQDSYTSNVQVVLSFLKTGTIDVNRYSKRGGRGLGAKILQEGFAWELNGAIAETESEFRFPEFWKMNIQDKNRLFVTAMQHVVPPQAEARNDWQNEVLSEVKEVCTAFHKNYVKLQQKQQGLSSLVDTFNRLRPQHPFFSRVEMHRPHKFDSQDMQRLSDLMSVAYPDYFDSIEEEFESILLCRGKGCKRNRVVLSDSDED